MRSTEPAAMATTMKDKPVILSVSTVKDAEKGERDRFLWDAELKGFGLKTTPTGSKVYIYQYRLAHPGQSAITNAKRYTIGRHGSLTPDQARRIANGLALKVANGIDPLLEKQAAREAEEERAREAAEAERKRAEKDKSDAELAFSRYAALWLDHYENEKGRRPSSVELAASVVRNHLKPTLGDKPMPSITAADIRAIIDAIPLKQKGLRRAVFAYASVLFGWAVKRGVMTESPIAKIERPEAPKGRDRVLSDAELSRVWRATFQVSDVFGPYFRLLVLTGQRRAEVAGMVWAELDKASATWTIPAARSKNGVAQIVPLSAPALKELDALAKLGELDKNGKAIEAWPKTGLTFTTTGTTPISGLTKAKRALDEAVAIDGGKDAERAPLPEWRVHDLRRTVATGLQRLGVRFEVTEAVLNHVSGAKGGIAGIYQRHDWKEEKRAALDAWARHVEALLNPATGDNVVSLDRAQKSA
jgi:integrase